MKVYLVSNQGRTYLGGFKSKEIKPKVVGLSKYLLSGLNGKYFVKCYSDFTKNLQVGDVFASFAYKKIGLSEEDYVDYRFAEYDTKYGPQKCTISKYFVPRGGKTISSYDIKVQNFAKQFGWNLKKFRNPVMEFELRSKMAEMLKMDFKEDGEYGNSVEDILKQVKTYAQNNNLRFNEKDTEFKLKRMVVLDYFFGQRDRHATNIEFIIHKNNISLTPIFDHERSFGMDVLIENRQPRDWFRLRTGLTTAGGNIDTYGKSRLFKFGGIVAVDIIEEAKSNQEIKDLANKCLNLDIEKLIEEFDSDIKALPEDIKKNIKTAFTSRRELFYKTVAELQKRTKRKDVSNLDFQLKNETLKCDKETERTQ